jgi:hypothetical protein
MIDILNATCSAFIVEEQLEVDYATVSSAISMPIF